MGRPLQPLSALLTPRPSVFADVDRDDVLDLSNLAQGRIDGEKFFAENFRTDGMTRLFADAFDRFRGEADTGLIKLTQQMGGGKTHNMLALGLLAKNTALRSRVLGSQYDDLGPVKVVCFGGRDYPQFGLWGEIAGQMGRMEVLQKCFTPLRAPGESEWIRLLGGERVLILLDELPAYLDHCRAQQVGNSDLAAVTTTALANLFAALGKKELGNVCLVLADLRAAYEEGGKLVTQAFGNLEQETARTAVEIQPVRPNDSEEMFAIVRKRLFEDVDWRAGAAAEAVADIARAYRQAVDDSRRLRFTGYDPGKMFEAVKDAYPFHPCIKDLYARFKENRNFQQTRGVIKLMRQMVRTLWESKRAARQYLINACDLDLAVPQQLEQLQRINPSFSAAITHDVAGDGQAEAEKLDATAGGGDYAQQAAKLLLVSSLSTTNAVRGLTEGETLAYLSAPGADVGAVKTALAGLQDRCWYLTADDRGRLCFNQIKNITAEMNDRAEQYDSETVRSELRAKLTELFTPHKGDCYQKLMPLPAIDDINKKIDKDKVTLVIFEAEEGTAIPADLHNWWENTPRKNRVGFLGSNQNHQANLYAQCKLLKAIDEIRENLGKEGVRDFDPRMKEAGDLLGKQRMRWRSAVVASFNVLYYPETDGELMGNPMLVRKDVTLAYKDNKFDGEEQLIAALKEAPKFQPEVKADDVKGLEVLRKKYEQRVFTVTPIKLTELEAKAAENPHWPWVTPGQVETLRAWCTHEGKWRVRDGCLEKGSFDTEPTSVQVEQVGYDEGSGEFTVQVTGSGGTVFYAPAGEPTEGDTRVCEGKVVTTDLHLYFRCFDPEHKRPTGAVADFWGEVPLKNELRATGDGFRLTLQSHPLYNITYTLDGSDVKTAGIPYERDSEIVLPPDCRVVAVRCAYRGHEILRTRIDIPVDGQGRASVRVQPDQELTYAPKQTVKCAGTEQTYATLRQWASNEIRMAVESCDFTLTSDSKDARGLGNYVTYTIKLPTAPWALHEFLELVRKRYFADTEVKVDFGYRQLRFNSGQDFLRWVEITRQDLNVLEQSGNIKQ